MEDKPIFFQHHADQMYYGMLKAFAKENRENMTEAESALWSMIRGNALGQKFRRQYIIGDFIVDFICLDKKLIIEVDGGYHSEPRQIEDDALRQQWLEERGFKVIRFTNEEVEFDSETVCKQIKRHLKENVPSNSPISGEE